MTAQNRSDRRFPSMIEPRFALFLCLGVAGCAVPAALPCDPGPAPRPVAWVVDYGWHTEIIVPADQIEGSLAAIRAMYPDVPVLSFGFGKQSFFTLDNPGSADLIAGAIPGAGAIRIIKLASEPVQGGQGHLLRVALTTAEWERLSEFLWNAMAHAPGRQPIRVTTPTPTNGDFFVAAHGYSLAYTCNTWTVDGLGQAGLSIGWRVSRSSSAMGEVAILRETCAPAAEARR